MSSKGYKNAEEKQQQAEQREANRLAPEDRIFMCPLCGGVGAISEMVEHGLSMTRECPKCKGAGEITG
jgi:DnaJ-class molecular chaperone